MVELLVLIVVAAVAIALGLWLFSNLGAVIAVVLLVAIVGVAFAAMGALFTSVGNLLGRRGNNVSATPEGKGLEKVGSPTLLEALDSAVKSVRIAAANERRNVDAIPEDARQVLDEVEKRKEFFRRQQLDIIASWLLRETWHYPAWSKRADAAKHLKLPASDIEARDDNTDGQRRTVAFTFQGCRMQMEFSRIRSFAGGPTGSLKLLIPNSGEVMSLTLTESEGSYDRWRVAWIESFKPGPWVPALVALYETAHVNEERERVVAEAGPGKIASLRSAFDV